MHYYCEWEQTYISSYTYASPNVEEIQEDDKFWHEHITESGTRHSFMLTCHCLGTTSPSALIPQYVTNTDAVVSVHQRQHFSEPLETMDGLPSNTTKEMLHALADMFGIHEVEIEGERQWAVDLQPTTDSSAGEYALFNAESKLWIPKRSVRPGTSTLMSLSSESLLSLSGVDHMGYLPPVQVKSNFHVENWADLLPNTPHINTFRNVDWSSTPLGALNTWPISLRLYIHTILFQPAAAMAIHWGQEQVAIYNESFIPLIGSAHPQFMGASFKEDWHNFKDPFEGLFHQLEKSGTGTNVKNHCLFVPREGGLPIPHHSLTMLIDGHRTCARVGESLSLPNVRALISSAELGGVLFYSH